MLYSSSNMYNKVYFDDDIWLFLFIFFMSDCFLFFFLFENERKCCKNRHIKREKRSFPLMFFPFFSSAGALMAY